MSTKAKAEQILRCTSCGGNLDCCCVGRCQRDFKEYDTIYCTENKLYGITEHFCESCFKKMEGKIEDKEGE